MRKSTIWLLAVVMAFAFAGLLFLQVKYVSIILKKSSEQFNETVKRSLHQVSKTWSWMKRRDIWKKILSVTRVIICKITRIPKRLLRQSPSRNYK